MGDESSLATPNSWCRAIGESIQPGPVILWGGGVIIRGLSGKGGLARKVGELSEESSVSTFVWWGRDCNSTG